MGITKMLARDWVFELNTGTTLVPDWVAIGAINKWAHSPKANDADTTTFDEDGRESHLKASRGDEFTLNGLYKEDQSNGDRDPGQEACEAWAAEIGPSSVKQFRITSPGGNTKTFDSTSTITFGGGGKDDPSAWDLAVKVTGAITSA
jgi:hypothetical protein